MKNINWYNVEKYSKLVVVFCLSVWFAYHGWQHLSLPSPQSCYNIDSSRAASSLSTGKSKSWYYIAPVERAPSRYYWETVTLAQLEAKQKCETLGPTFVQLIGATMIVALGLLFILTIIVWLCGGISLFKQKQ